ncbi:hypothetical protein AXF42_Ash001187 [Apostasia shenzhenica]|uniref:Uncharacterized protein n=1 Tax=Apostasia shenzhenica TaxID=1088818 RepID=A0A2I0AU70_9ASPA|nr:hypothetical protein AXF42_Ash001187 [Apostasia shenzhenica]
MDEEFVFLGSAPYGNLQRLEHAGPWFTCLEESILHWKRCGQSTLTAIGVYKDDIRCSSLFPFSSYGPLVSTWPSIKTIQQKNMKMVLRLKHASCPSFRHAECATTGRNQYNGHLSDDGFDQEPFWSLRSLVLFLFEQPSQLKYIEWPSFDSTGNRSIAPVSPLLRRGNGEEVSSSPPPPLLLSSSPLPLSLSLCVESQPQKATHFPATARASSAPTSFFHDPYSSNNGKQRPLPSSATARGELWLKQARFYSLVVGMASGTSTGCQIFADSAKLIDKDAEIATSKSNYETKCY